MPGGEQVNVVLSDASVDQRLIDQGGLAIKDVFLTHPRLAEDYNGPSGFGAYGSSASQIVRQLLDGANDQFGQVASANGGFGYWYRHLLGLRRATDARIVIAALMKDAVIQERRFSLDGKPCGFRGNGSRVDASFHIWQVQHRAFVTVP